LPHEEIGAIDFPVDVAWFRHIDFVLLKEIVSTGMPQFHVDLFA
jgi:hypothetical protein